MSTDRRWRIHVAANVQDACHAYRTELLSHPDITPREAENLTALCVSDRQFSQLQHWLAGFVGPDHLLNEHPTMAPFLVINGEMETGGWVPRARPGAKIPAWWAKWMSVVSTWDQATRIDIALPRQRFMRAL
jgi:hypothetical protein